MESGLEGKIALVTGASGGIGRAVAEALAAEGCSLILHGHRRLEELEIWVKEQPWKDRAYCAAADLRDPAQIDAVVEAGREHFGRIDICVANAGAWPTADRPLHEMDVDRFADTISTNLLGSAWTARAFLRALQISGPREDGDGASLIFTGSTAARFGERDHCDYAAAKAGLLGLARSLKNEIVRLDPYGRVNVVEPGWTVTRMARAALQDDAVVRRVAQTIPMPQLGRAQDVARAIVFLASPLLSRHINGENLGVTGGMEGRILHQFDEVDLKRLRSRIEDAG